MIYAITQTHSGITLIASSTDADTPPRIDVIPTLEYGTFVPDFHVSDLVFVEHVAPLDTIALRAHVRGACVHRIIYRDSRSDILPCDISNTEEIAGFSPDIQTDTLNVRKLYRMGITPLQYSTIPLDSFGANILHIKACVQARTILLDLIDMIEKRALTLEYLSETDILPTLFQRFNTSIASLKEQVDTIQATISDMYISKYPELGEMRDHLHCPPCEMEEILAEIVDPRRFSSEHAIAACVDMRRRRHNRRLRSAVRAWCRSVERDKTTEWPAWLEKHAAYQLYLTLMDRERLARSLGIDISFTPKMFAERKIGNAKQIQPEDMKDLMCHLSFFHENHPEAWKYAADAASKAHAQALKRMEKRLIRKLYRRWMALLRKIPAVDTRSTP